MFSHHVQVQPMGFKISKPLALGKYFAIYGLTKLFLEK
jgi:hypothetical protein